MKEKKKTIVINLFGLFGRDKTVCGSWLYSQLSLKGYSCKLISEISCGTLLTSSVYDCPMYTTGKRLYNIQSSYGDVDFIITDSPIIEDCIYCGCSASLSKAIIEEFDKFDNLNISLNYDNEIIAIDNIVNEWLVAKDVPHINVDNNEDGFNKIVDVAINCIKQNESISVDKPFANSLDIRSQLWAEAQKNGFIVSDKSTTDEMFYEYTFKNKKKKYIIRISDKPCDNSTWKDKFGYNAVSTLNVTGQDTDKYEKCYISYVVNNSPNVKSTNLSNVYTDGVSYKEICFSTVSNDEADLYNLKDSIRDLTSCDIDNSLIAVGKDLLVRNGGQCEVIEMLTVFNFITYEPVSAIVVRNKKSGKEYKINNPKNDILDYL
jgi:hypothetical protein